MRKITLLLFAAAVVLAFTSCDYNAGNQTPTSDSTSVDTVAAEPVDSALLQDQINSEADTMSLQMKDRTNEI